VGGKPGFVRDASEVFAANRAATASKLADVAGETASAGQRAVKAAKQLVNPETNMVMGKAERAASGLVEDAPSVVGHGAVAAENATNAGTHVAETAAEVAKTTAKSVAEEMPTAPGRAGRFANYVAKKGLAVAKSPVTGPIETAKSFASAGRDIVQAVTHPQLLERPLSAGPRAVGTVAKVAGKTIMGVGHSLPAIAVGYGVNKGVDAVRRPGAGDVADKEMATNMGMSVEDFRGIRAVSEKKGAAGIAALVSGLAKTQSQDLVNATKQPLADTLSASLSAKKKAASALRANVSSAYTTSLAKRALTK
jgi:hypothetical protein